MPPHPPIPEENSWPTILVKNHRGRREGTWCSRSLRWRSRPTISGRYGTALGEAQVAAFLIGSILMFLIAIFLLRTFREVITGRANLGLGPLIGPVLIIRPPGAWSSLGLTPSAMQSVFGLARLLLERRFCFCSFWEWFTLFREARGELRAFLHYVKGTIAAGFRIRSPGLWGLLFDPSASDTSLPGGSTSNALGLGSDVRL